ncbi:glycosyl hydrolase 53 family protein [Paenibacillus endoradicis]|uniref:glycosyl hydrolase 53 family protein n=1 Tax=Paenibacillus endoradicis TaxID=2972487 RepID=UPI00215996EA|nr:glycosyl hydrolase 53 family protein [Paenibacillus endoradicis]MCR8657764.1 glycosyl hydrolase 53 family protein [Paenibacillus endoradicis]
MKKHSLISLLIALSLIITLWQPVIGTASAAELNTVPSIGLSINGEATTWNVAGTQPEKLWDDSTNTFLEYYDAKSLDFTLSKQLTDVPSGKYNLSVLLHGDKGKTLDAQSVMSATTSEGTFTELISFTGSDWGKPVPLTLNNIMVGTDGIVTISFKIVMNSELYGYLQDVQFTQGAAVTKTTIKPNSAVLRPNASVQLTTTHSVNETVEYSSSNEDVAIVSVDGLVEAVAEGTATITAKVYNEGELLRTGTSAIYVSSTLQDYTGTEISVEPIVELEGSNRSDFMMGADISSLYALEKVGRKYYDLAGQETSMIQALKDGGVNWIRLRTWVDPTDGKGNSYGAGDVNEAVMIEMAKDAKAADLNVLVDLHYSDFWADPGRQNTPKAWAKLTESELQLQVYEYTYETLEALKAENVYPDMIQIGNEINGGLLWPLGNSAAKAKKYIAQGIKAVRDFETKVGDNKHIDIVIHRANPNDGLAKVSNFYATYDDLDYDVIGLSYYPFWHGSLDNIQEVMNGLAAKFDRKVAIVETSYGYTLEDPINNGDTGHVFGQAQADTAGYLATVQGQASAIRDVINAVAKVPDAQGVGVFYWEPGWLLGTDTGWATKYAASYQGESIPTDGGASWANQALFNYFGEALPSIEVFNLVRQSLDDYEQPTLLSVNDIAITTSQGVYVELPTKVKALYTDDTYRDIKVQSWTPSEYNVSLPGTTQLTGTLITGQEIKANITVTPFNYIVNPGIEDADMSAWQLTGAERGQENAYLGSYAIHFWNHAVVNAKQQISNLPDGIYELSVQSQIGIVGEPIADTSQLYATNEAGTSTEPLVVTGWGNWKKIVVKDIVVENGKLEIGVTVNDAIEDYGDFDDWQLIRTGDLTTTPKPTPKPTVKPDPTTSTDNGQAELQLSLQTVGNAQVWKGIVKADATSATIKLPTSSSADHVVIQWGENQLEFSLEQLASLIPAGNGSDGGLYIQWKPQATVANTELQLTGQQGAQIVAIGKPFNITVQATTATGTVLPQLINLPISLTFALDANIDLASVALYQLNDKGELSYVGGITSNSSIQAVVNDGATYVLANVSRVYSDITNPNEQLRKLTAMGVIEGDQHGRANLDQHATRAEISKIITKLFGLDSELVARQLNQPLPRVVSEAQSLTFTDVPVNHWASSYINLLTERQWLVGTGQDKFSPNKEMSYEEIYTLISRILQLPLSKQQTIPAYEASNWALPYIESLIQAGMISTEQASTIDFKEKVTRGSIISIAYELLQTLEKLNK